MEDSGIKGLVDELKQLNVKATVAQDKLRTKLQEQPIDPNLSFFFGDGCPFTKRAQPAIDCLEIHLGKRLNRLETWNNDENHDSYVAVGGIQNCGGVPFFYNKTTGKHICGVTSCEKLVDWADAKYQFDLDVSHSHK